MFPNTLLLGYLQKQGWETLVLQYKPNGSC